MSQDFHSILYFCSPNCIRVEITRTARTLGTATTHQPWTHAHGVGSIAWLDRAYVGYGSRTMFVDGLIHLAKTFQIAWEQTADLPGTRRLAYYVNCACFQ
jgi:hypothetical protein